MAEKWGNGHYTCYGCSEQNKPKNEQYRCSNCFTYTPLMQGYYKNWTKEEKKQTNADRIRSMTDEELAQFLKEYFSCEYECPAHKEACICDCNGAINKWLQKECEV